MTAPAPIRVAVLDVAEPLHDLDCHRHGEPPYGAAWVLACRAGTPLGSVQIPLHGERIEASELERELRGALGAAWERGPVPDGRPLARATVVVPTDAARPGALRRCVARLQELDHPDYEVIVVDNRAPGAPALELEGALVVREPRPGISAARNRGLAAASGEIVAFTDDDVEVDRGWLRALGRRFARDPAVAAVTGLVVPRELETPAQIWFEQSGSGLDRGYEALTFERAGRFTVRRRSASGDERVHSLYAAGEFGLGSNMAFRASALRAAGGFDVALGTGTPACGGEDLAMLIELLAAGHPIAYEPTAITHHSHRATPEELERQLHGYGVGFTAMLTAVALRHPSQLIGLAAIVPAWLRSLRDPASRTGSRPPEYPRALARAQLSGMAVGPFEYVRARREQRRWIGPDPDWRPIKVSVIDVERCPESIDGESRYAGLWALVRERGRPRGIVRLPFSGGAIDRLELLEAITRLPPAVTAEPLERPADGHLPRISVVIPTLLERGPGLDACLHAMAELDYPDYEVLVVDNRPAGAPEATLEGARLLREPSPGISAARNRGLAAATGEIVAFTDDDVEVDPKWLLAIALRLRAHPDEAGVTGLLIPREFETPAQLAIDDYYGGVGPVAFEPVSHRLRIPPGRGACLRPATVDAIDERGRVLRSFSLYATGSFGAGANMAFRREALRAVGGFDVTLGAGSPARGGEDLGMFARLLWRGDALGADPAMLVRHAHHRDDAALARQLEGWGTGYTALMLALVLEDPRHLGRMLGTASRVLRSLAAGHREAREGPRADPRLRELARLERRGMLAGPRAYLRSRRRSP